MTDSSHATDTALTAVPDPDETDDISTDGRTMRRKRNREAVIEALISLIREGDLSPTVAAIADRAQVSHRSIFRYFDDLNDLARTAIDTAFRKSFSLSVIPDVGKGRLEYRVETMVKKYVDTLEHTHSLGRVARSRQLEIPEIDRGLTTIAELRLEQIRAHFAPELEQMTEPHADAITSSIMSIVSLDAYDMKLRVFDRTRDEIARDWRTSLLALLT